jgi:N-acetylmuramic acid 6-phosphate (MurNAc-6-P) etherase
VAFQALEQAHGHVKCAIVMILANVDEAEARARLDAAAGHIRKAIA